MGEKAVVTGAAGFTGAVLVEELRKRGVEVFALVRPGSAHNVRLDASDRGLHIMELDLRDISLAKDRIPRGVDIFYHLAVTGGMSFDTQYVNVRYTLDTVMVAYALGCNRFVGIGSQAEYGVVPPNEIILEERVPEPVTAYGAAKLVACYLSCQLAMECGIEWMWGRIFSVIGKYEPENRMLPDLYHALREGREMQLSSCRQNWDYLDVYDAADAILAIGENGVPGEVYNIANGNYRPLREYTEELRDIVRDRFGTSGGIVYGEDPDPFVSLQPSVDKIRKDTGWSARRDLEDSVRGWESTR